MLAICALLLLSSVVDANHLRSNNDILPLNVVFEDTEHVGYTFIQDPLHPHKEDSIALQVSYRTYSTAKKAFYLCEVHPVRRYREDNHIMIDSDNYEVSRHRKDRFLLLTRYNYNTVLKLTETDQTRHCVSDMIPAREFHIPYAYVVTPAPNDQFMGWTDIVSPAGKNVEYYSARTGAAVSTDLLELSPAAVAACPSCNILSGWDGEHHWFCNNGYFQHPDGDIHFVNAQTGAHFSWPRMEYILSTKVSRTYLLVETQGYPDWSKWWVYLRKKTDGSLHRKLLVPRLVNAINQCLGPFLSPDESRVLMVCPWSYQQKLSPASWVNLSFLVEISADTGAVLRMSTLSDAFTADSYFGGNRYSDNSILVRANNEDIHMYKYSV